MFVDDHQFCIVIYSTLCLSSITCLVFQINTSTGFEVSNQIRHAFEARIFQIISAITSDLRRVFAPQHFFLQRIFHYRRRRVISEILAMGWLFNSSVVNHGVPFCRHAILTSMRWRSYVLRLRGGIPNCKYKILINRIIIVRYNVLIEIILAYSE